MPSVEPQCIVPEPSHLYPVLIIDYYGSDEGLQGHSVHTVQDLYHSKANPGANI